MYRTIRVDTVDGCIRRVTLSRVEVRNAQNRRMTYELNDAFTSASRDPEVKVIVLAGDGPHFSSGHDLNDREAVDAPLVGLSGGFDRPGVEGYMAYEDEVYLQMCRRWREIPKPTIASVHGKTIAGGLMLMWVCDLIIAADDATFADPVVAFGVNGVEWFAHPWELGTRKAKEFLFTGEPITADQACQLGMVNRVVPAAVLEEETLALARRIAAKPSFGLHLAKLACNQAQDAQGFWTAQQAAFSLQHLGHGHARERFGLPVDPSGLTSARPAVPAADAVDESTPLRDN